jgi:hypothetical protein
MAAALVTVDLVVGVESGAVFLLKALPAIRALNLQ